jgi:hypothetical protein
MASGSSVYFFRQLIVPGFHGQWLYLDHRVYPPVYRMPFYKIVAMLMYFAVLAH